MTHFIDRRLNPKDKSLGNRRRFLRRVRKHVKSAVDKAVKDRRIEDVNRGDRVRVPYDGIREPSFHYQPGSGHQERVLHFVLLAGGVLVAVRAGLPFAAAKLRIVDDRRVERALDEAGPVDAVIINGTGMGGAFERVLTGRPYLYVAHNVEHATAAEAAGHATGPLGRAMYAREARLLRSLETRLVRGAAQTFTLTEEDRAELGLAGSDRARVLPLVMPRSAETPGPRVPAFDIGMIGTWTWAPNRIGLEWFLQSVLPQLPETVTVAIAGQLPAGFPRRDKRVRFLGRVIDAGQFLRQCRVVALTARAGTGVQLKTIETFEAGLPAVATPSSVRGIADIPANARVVDEPAAFARALADHVVAHRTGALVDADGDAFRAGQMARMDAAITDALAGIGAAVNRDDNREFSARPD